MNLKLEDVYKAYKELETTIEQFRESKFKTLSKLLGHDRAFKAAFKIEFAGDLLTYLKKFEGWTDEEKFLDTYIRNKKFLDKTTDKHTCLQAIYTDVVFLNFIKK